MALSAAVAKSHVLHRTLHDEPMDVVSGNGIRFQLANGKTIIDASSGPAVACLGHRQPEVEMAIMKQLSQIGYVYSGSRYTCEAAEELASLLLQDRPGGLCKAIFVNSGSEATDAALKLATQYWCEMGQKQRVNVIGRKSSYHGNTLGALAVSGHETRREFYAHWMPDNTSFVNPCFAYREKGPQETDEDYVERLKVQLEDEIVRLGPDTVAAFIAETVSGTTLGCAPAVPGYFVAIRELCDKYGILLILDEIMCGLGKTGTMHAWEQEGISPDIETIGKALGGGFVPLSGVLLNQKVFDALAHGTGALAHGHTFQAHPVACAAAVAVQRIIRRDNILENVKAMGQLLEEQLKEQIGYLPYVGDIRGRGLFWAIEFMENPVTMTPFPSVTKHSFSQRVVQAALDLGLNILGNLGKTGALEVEHVLLSPPYIITANEVSMIVSLLREAILIVGKEYKMQQQTKIWTESLADDISMWTRCKPPTKAVVSVSVL